MSTSTNLPKRKRGRPTAAATWRTLDEVAEITGLPVAMVERLLERVPNALPGATLDPDGWRVPERALRALLGAPCGPLPQYATVAEVAESLRVSVHAVYRWLKTRMPDGSWMLPHRAVLGQKLIRADDVMRLPARMPGPPLSFFVTDGRRCEEP